jgi:hypothetical protein
MASRTLLRRITIGLAAGSLVLVSTGCSKRSIDVGQTGSVEVNGTNGTLKKFCDGSILIYWTPGLTSTDDDDYEFIVYDGCTKDGKIINGDNAQSRPRTEDLQPGNEDEN